MSNISRSIKRRDNLLRKDREKKNTRGEKKGRASVGSLLSQNSSTVYTYLNKSFIEKDIELPDPNPSCRHCYGTGTVGKLVHGSEKRESVVYTDDFICTCVVRHIKLPEKVETDDNNQSDSECSSS